MVYFIATLYPHLEKHNKKDYRGPWLSAREQREQIDLFYKEKSLVPLSFEHLNCSKYAYIKFGDRIGEVIDLFTGKNGDLMVKCRLDSDHPAALKIQKDVIENKIRWGVSVGLSQLESGNDDDGKTIKKLIHVAFTTSPGFGEHNTYLHYWHLKESPIDSVINRLYFKEGEGKSYASETLKNKIRGMRERLFHCDVIFYFEISFT